MSSEQKSKIILVLSSVDLKLKEESYISFILHEKEEFILFSSSMNLNKPYLEKVTQIKSGTFTDFQLDPQKVSLEDRCDHYGKGRVA